MLIFSILTLATYASFVYAVPTVNMAESATGNFSLSASANTGRIVVRNHCSYGVWIQPVEGGSTPKGHPENYIARNGVWSDEIRALKDSKGNSVGVSVKISKDQNTGHWTDNILQIEYTIDKGRFWYDGSNVNCRGAGCPFYEKGVMIQSPGTKVGSNCKDVVCKPKACDSGKNWYIQPYDNQAVRDCAQRSDLTVHLCSTRPL